MSEEIFLYFIAHILIGLTSFFLGFLVFIKNKNKINIFFFLFSLAISLWAFSYAIWIISVNYQQALFFARTLNFFALFIPAFYLHWILLYFDQYDFKKVLLAYSTTVIFAFFGYSQLFIPDVSHLLIFDFYPQSGFVHKLFLVEWSVIILYGCLLLFSQYKKTQDVQRKKQILSILVGTGVGFLGGSTNFLLMLGIDFVPPLASALVIVFPIMISYAMIKYNLMDIRVVLMQVMLMIMNIAGIALVFTSDTTIEYVFKSSFTALVLFVSLLLIRNYNKEVKQKEELFRLSNELKRANEELKRLDKAKSEFISIASHQLRTPLTAIKGYISLILEGAYGKNSVKTDDALNKIFLANERIIQLVEDLLNITRIESGRLEYHFDEGIHAEDVVEELKDMFTLRTEEKKLDFVVKYPDKKTSPIKADKSKLREVISNLIDNSIKYTPKGFVHVSVEQEKNIVRVIVEDSGMGISPESMQTLFLKFSRGTDSSKVYTEGTGLGLYVGKNLIESQGGHIYAESEGVNKGARFVIEMPVQKK